MRCHKNAIRHVTRIDTFAMCLLHFILVIRNRAVVGDGDRCMKTPATSIAILQSLNPKQDLPDLLPEFVGKVRPLYSLDVEVDASVLFPYSSIPAVGQRTRATIAKACHIVFIAAEILGFGFGLVGAVPMVDDLQEERHI